MAGIEDFGALIPGEDAPAAPAVEDAPSADDSIIVLCRDCGDALVDGDNPSVLVEHSKETGCKAF